MKNIISKEARSRNSDSPLYTVQGTLEDFQKLSESQQEDVLYEALTNFTCRTGKWGDGLEAKVSPKLEAFRKEVQGKVIGFARMAEFLALVGERTASSEPTKADVALAKQRLVVIKADAKKRDEADPDGDFWAFVKHEIELCAGRNFAAYAEDGFQWEWQEIEKDKAESLEAHLERQALGNLSRIVRAARLAVERRNRKASPLL